jgi:hypothetical protein
VGTLAVAGSQWFSCDRLRQGSGLMPGARGGGRRAGDQRPIVRLPQAARRVLGRRPCRPGAGDPDRGERGRLSSLGIDLHATLNRYVDLAFDIGWELRDAAGTDKRGAFGDIAVVVGF